VSGRRVLYRGARLLDPLTGTDRIGDLLTEDEVIAALDPDIDPGDAQVVDGTGYCLAPGLIDVRVFVQEPGAEHRETFATAGAAAAAGGVTTLITMPNTDPVIDDVALVQYVTRRARETSPVRIQPMAALTKGLDGRRLTEMGLLGEAGALAFTDGDRALGDALVMSRALSYARAFDALIVAHAEEPTLSAGGAMNQGEIATRLGLPGIPKAAETILIERDLRLVEITGGRYHVAQVTCAESIAAVAQAKQRGLPVTCGTAPHYFALNESAVAQYRTFAKTSPPLRAEADRQAVVAGLAAGVIDVICSSHHPQDPESKRRPFAQAAPGAVGLETMLAVALELVHRGDMAMLDVLATLTSSPARLLGLAGGRLAPGAPADLVLFDPAAPWLVDADKFRSKSKNSPFDERPLQGHAVRTVVAGRTVFVRRVEGA